MDGIGNPGYCSCHLLIMLTWRAHAVIAAAQTSYDYYSDRGSSDGYDYSEDGPDTQAAAELQPGPATTSAPVLAPVVSDAAPQQPDSETVTQPHPEQVIVRAGPAFRHIIRAPLSNKLTPLPPLSQSVQRMPQPSLPRFRRAPPPENVPRAQPRGRGARPSATS